MNLPNECRLSSHDESYCFHIVNNYIMIARKLITEDIKFRRILEKIPKDMIKDASRV